MTRAPVLVVVLSGWVVMGVCSGMLMIEGAAVAVLFLTCGIGMVTFVLPTMWLYVTPALPLVVAWAARGPIGLAAVVSALAVVGAAFVPGTASLAVRDWDAARLRADDRSAPLPAAPRTVRLVVPGGSLRPDRAAERTLCEAPCQALLYGGEVDQVEVLATGSRGDSVSTTWRREARAACDDPFPRAEDALPAVKQALALGDCLVAEPGRLLSEAPWIRLETRWLPDAREASTSELLYRIDRILVLTAGDAGSALDAPTLRHTAVYGNLLQRPTAIVPDSNGMNMSLALWRAPDAVGPTSWEDGLREAFGYVLAPLPEPAAPDLLFLGRMLDRPGDTPFGPTGDELARAAFVARRADRARPLSADEVTVLERVLRDPRFVDLPLLVDVVADDPAAVARLVPAMVVRVGLPYREDLRHTQSRVAWTLARLDPELLRPHAPALLAALRAYPGWGTDALLGVLPLVTDEVAPELAAALEDERLSRAAIVGVCNASPEVAVPLLDRVEAVARAADELPPGALLALRRHGRAEVADALLAAREPKERRRAEAEAERLAVAEGGCQR